MPRGDWSDIRGQNMSKNKDVHLMEKMKLCTGSLYIIYIYIGETVAGEWRLDPGTGNYCRLDPGAGD